MDDQMTKPRLLETLRSKRAAWDALLAQVPPEQIDQPGVAGSWSVKNIIAHLTYHERWLADRMHENLRGEVYVPRETDQMDFDQLNELVYQQQRDRSVAEVLHDSHAVFDQLVAAIEAHSEAFLIEPQQFPGVPVPVTIWKLLRGNVYEHYGQHAPAIREWLAAQQQRAG